MSDFIDEMINNAPDWVFQEVDDRELVSLSGDVHLSRRIRKIFYLRGIRTSEDLHHFLYDDILDLHNPFDFNKMSDAVSRVKKAVYNGETIFIFGDRDVDGVLSTAMMYNMLRMFDANVIFRVPEGEYGYGIEKKDIEYAQSRGVSLIITVDTGVSSKEEIEDARSLGIDTIIIDHHTEPDDIPDDTLILNPKMEHERYPFRDLSAGGVVLKFIHAYIFSYTKNFNRIFTLLVPEGEKICGVTVKNGRIIGTVTIEESLHYPIDEQCMVVSDAKKSLPEYFSSWLKEKKIDRMRILCKKPYIDPYDFAGIFLRLFSQKQKKTIEFVRSYIDLSAVSTISDIMPLVDENRIIVKEGLQQISRTENLGLKVLSGYCEIPRDHITAKHVSWNISPVINAAGRMGDANIAVKLFTTTDEREANDLSSMLIRFNESRKRKGERNLSIINPMIEKGYYRDPVIVLSTDRAEHGVTGIIANKIARKFSKPAIIIVNDGDIGIGSGRGPGNFDLVSLVSRCDDLLLKYGGHRSAVGFTIETNKIDLFRKKIQRIVLDEHDRHVCKERVGIDDIITSDDVSPALYDELRIFEPTGTGNPPPKFSILGTAVVNPGAIGKSKNHVKFHIPSSSGLVSVLGWGLADKAFRVLRDSSVVDIVFTIEENIFRGEKSIQLLLIDLRESDSDQEKVETLKTVDRRY
jgi:single-stranded-DNA-specific exonuclease